MKKTVKAWAVHDNHANALWTMFMFRTKKEAKKAWPQKFFSFVPVTITYELPKKK